jgi:hypothetical protein
LDSLNALSSKQWLTDSLSVLAWADSLKTGVTTKTSGVINKLNHQLDSLNGLQLPTGKLTRKIDSLNQRKNHLLSEVNNKQAELLGNTKKKLSDWQARLKSKLGMDGSGLPISNSQSLIPNSQIPNADLKIPSLGAVDFQNMGLPSELSEINQSLPFSKMDGLSEWQSKLGDVGGKLSSFSSIPSNPDKLIETAASNIDGVKEIQKLSTGGLEQTEMGKIMKAAENPEAVKQMAIDQVKKEAINHFAGKEQVLQTAMEQISKYKKAYPSVNSLSDIKKRPPNPMKGKPFIERLVPGFALQIHTKNYLNFDVTPFAAYKLSGRFSIGLGWNQRFAMDWSSKTFMHEGRVYGPRAFTDFKLPRGFAIRLEAEYLNTYVPPYLASTDSKRQWVFGTMTGLKKDYRLFKKVKGFTIVQFDLVRLFKTTNNSPYADVVNTRFGFEFPMKKKAKKKAD